MEPEGHSRYRRRHVQSETLIDTALGTIFNGQWEHCWMEYGVSTDQRINDAINTWVPDADNVLIVLNEPGFGGCGGGGRAHVTLGVGWDVIAHEFGHGIGGLADEYSNNGNYAGGEQGWVNLTTITDRATTKWRQFINPTTPLPTGVGAAANYNQGPRPATWSSNFDAVLFEGGGTLNTGIYRPVENCRMNGNSPEYCPVCYTSFKTNRHTETGHHFRGAYAGNFLGSGRSDVLLHHGTAIQLFRNNNAGLTHSFTGVERVPGSWQFMPNDQIVVGDFNGDGVDEVVIFNGVDWVMPYLGLLVSDGTGGLRLIARYDGDIPGWGGFARNDKFYAADLNGDGKDDLIVINGDDWSMTYVGLLRSTGWGFYLTNRYDGDIPGWGGLARHDQFFVGDLSGDGSDDVVIFNGEDWSMAYVGLFLADRGGAEHDRPLRRRHPRLGRAGPKRQVGPRRLRRRWRCATSSSSTGTTGRWPTWACSARPAGTGVRATGTTATYPAGVAWPATTGSSPRTSTGTAAATYGPGTTRTGRRNTSAAWSPRAPASPPVSSATG